MALVLKECPVCGESIPFDRVVFYKCGHKLCSSCSARALKHKPECSVCRDPILKQPPHRIYLTVDELVQESAIDAATGVANTSGIIKKLRNDISQGPPISGTFIKDNDDIEDIITPILERLEEIKRENEQIQQQLRTSQTNQQLYKDKVKKMKLALLNENQEKMRQQSRADDYINVIKDRDATISKLAEEREDQDKQIKLVKTKLKALAKLEKHQRRRSQDTNSLQIDEIPQDLPPRSKRSSGNIGLEYKAEPGSATPYTKRRKQVIT